MPTLFASYLFIGLVCTILYSAIRGEKPIEMLLVFFFWPIAVIITAVLFILALLRKES